MKLLGSITTLCICFATGIHAQVYFDNLYGSNTISEGFVGGGSIQYQGGYLNLAYSGGDYRKPFLIETDLLGFQLSEFILDEGDSLWQFAVRLMHYDDSTFFVLCGTSGYEGGQLLPLDYGLFKFNGSGLNLQFNIYGYSDRSEYPQDIIKDQNGRILLLGSTIIETPNNTDADLYLICLDLSGNPLFEKEYGGNNYEGAGNHSILQTPDHGFLLLGWTRSFGAGQRDFYLVKTDSVGNQQWQKTYGGGGGDEIGAGILQLSDGNYLLTGSGSQGTQQGSGSLGRVYKIRPDGTQIWSKTYIYNSNSGNGLFKTIEMWNGDLVSVGVTDNNSNSGYMIRTDSLGEIIWQREYDKNANTDLFYSVLLANDGGFLLSGQARNLETNSQDAWLLKVDSVGCPYPNCTVGVDEVETGKVVVDVWPNPASEVLNVQLQQPGRAQITIIDMAGRSYFPPVVERSGVVGPYMQYDVSALPNGVYVLSVVQTEMKTSLKIVVQH